MEFSRQEYLSGLPFPSPGDLSNPGIKPGSPVLQADSSPSEGNALPIPDHSGSNRGCFKWYAKIIEEHVNGSF